MASQLADTPELTDRKPRGRPFRPIGATVNPIFRPLRTMSQRVEVRRTAKPSSFSEETSVSDERSKWEIGL